MTADVSPSWQWQFPAEEPVSSWRGPLSVRRLVPASADVPGPSVSTFRVDHLPAEAGLGAWQAHLTQAHDDQAKELDAPSAAAELTEEEPAAEWNEAARVWTKCYQASAEPTRAALCLVLGARVDFDGLVAHQLLEHHLLLCADDLAQRALSAAAQTGDAMASDPAALVRLGAELRAVAPELRRALLPEAKPLPPGAQPEGLPAWDARLAAWLDRLGTKALAKEVRQRGQEAVATGGAALWDKWLPSAAKPPLRRLTFAALGLWQQRVRHRLDVERRRPKAVVRPVYASPVVLMHAGAQLVEGPDGQSLHPGLHEGGMSCRIAHADARLFARIRAGIDKLGTLTAHRLIRWEIATGYQQFLDRDRDPEADPRVIKIVGGYRVLAREHLGLTSNDDVTAVRDIIAAQDACVFDFPWANDGAGQNGRLLIREEVAAARGRPAQLRLVLGTMLLPHFADLVKHQEGQRGQAIKLVPVTDLPPLVGRPNEQGAQVSLSMMFVLWLRDRAKVLHQEGSVRLRQADLQRLAREVGLKDAELLTKVWDRWQRDGDDAPAFVKLVDADRYTLADAHAAARQSILDAGRGEADGTVWGKASAAKQRGLPGGGPRRLRKA